MVWAMLRAMLRGMKLLVLMLLRWLGEVSGRLRKSGKRRSRLLSAERDGLRQSLRRMRRVNEYVAGRDLELRM